MERVQLSDGAFAAAQLRTVCFQWWLLADLSWLVSASFLYSFLALPWYVQ
jgi:hypothetical protein